MAYSKAQLFPKDIFQESQYAKALAHPARIEILRHLFFYGPTKFRDLASTLPLHSSTVSQHIRTLRQFHLIEYTESGPFVIYLLNPALRDRIEKNRVYFHQLFSNSGYQVKND